MCILTHWGSKLVKITYMYLSDHLITSLRELTISLPFSSWKNDDFHAFWSFLFYAFLGFYWVKTGRKWLVRHPRGCLNTKNAILSFILYFFVFFGKNARDFKKSSILSSGKLLKTMLFMGWVRGWGHGQFQVWGVATIVEDSKDIA